MGTNWIYRNAKTKPGNFYIRFQRHFKKTCIQNSLSNSPLFIVDMPILQIKYTEAISIPTQNLIIQVLINFVNSAEMEMAVAKLLCTKAFQGRYSKANEILKNITIHFHLHDYWAS